MRKLVSTFFAGRTLFYSLIFLTPFIFSTTTNEAFEFPKMYFGYFVGTLFVLTTFLRQLWVTDEQREGNGTNDSMQRRVGGKENIRISLLVGLFVISFGISTVFSTHPQTSFWGYFSRFNGGLVSVVIFYGIYLATLYLKPKTRTVLKTAALTLVPISLYSILQHFGFGGSWATDTTVRAFSTFGQPNWYGAYSAMVLPIVLYLGLHGDAQNSKEGSRNSLGWFALVIVGFTGFWFSYSVSGIIGLVCSSALVVGLNLRATKKKWRSLAVLAGLCLAIALLNQGIFNQKITDALTDIFTKPPVTTQSMDDLSTQSPEGVNTQAPELPSEMSTEQARQNQPTQNELTNYQLTDSGFIRKGIWEGTIRLWLASPKNFLIGTGPETFPYEFQRFRPLSLNYSSEWNYILNKPHNYFLELLAQNGLAGLLIYLVIIIKTLLAKHSALTPALTGLFVTNFFGWPTVSTTLLFWIFLALLTGAKRKDGKSLAVLQKFSSPVRAMVISSGLCLVYLYANMQFGGKVLADIFSKASERYFETGESQKALNFSNKAASLNPNEPFYYRQKAKTYMLTAVGQPDDRIAQIKDMAHKDLMISYKLNPQNLATLRGLIPLYYFLALNDLLETANNQSQKVQTDPNYLQPAREYYLKLSQSYPNDVGVQAQVAKYQEMLGLVDDVEVTVSIIRKLRPDLLDWYINF